MYLVFFILAIILSLFFTGIARALMRYFRIQDNAKQEDRKIHKGKIPYGGGLAIFSSLFIIILGVFQLTNYFGNNVSQEKIWGLFFGGLVLMIGGILDDKYRLPAKLQIWFPILASFLVVLFGIGPEYITNPWGGTINMGIKIGWFFTLADLLVFFWLMGMMFTTKFLDGLDGLVGGVVAIGALIVFFLCLQDKWFQPDVALLAIIFAGVMLGFLVWNFHPAKVFLGEGGSLFAGFMLGALAVISGGKIATTLLVMGIPVLDVLRVIVIRLKHGKPVYEGDSEHLHFRLLRSGLSQTQAVLLLYSISFLFGITTLFLQSKQKVVALLFIFLLMILLGIWISDKEKKD